MYTNAQFFSSGDSVESCVLSRPKRCQTVRQLTIEFKVRRPHQTQVMIVESKTHALKVSSPPLLRIPRNEVTVQYIDRVNEW